VLVSFVYVVACLWGSKIPIRHRNQSFRALQGKPGPLLVRETAQPSPLVPWSPHCRTLTMEVLYQLS